MKSVLIIGGCSDIGVNLSKKFIALGYNVMVGYNRNKVYIDGAELVKCDIRNEEEIEKVIKYGIEKYGKIDFLINLACISRDNSFLNKTKSEFMDVLEVNLVGTFLTNQIYSRYIDDGIIVNISSTDGIDTYSQYSIDYSASKAGIINISKSISMGTKNKILCICPNWIDSDSTNMMDRNYLESELNRIGQSRLISLDELNDSIIKIIDEGKSGEVFRIDIKDGNLWIERI